MSDTQTVRLVFLGEHGEALRSTNAVITGTKQLTAAQRQQITTAREVANETGRSTRAFRDAEHEIGRAARGAIAGSGAFHALGRSLAFASAGFLGGAGLGFAIRSAIDEMQQAARVGAQTEQVIRTTGGAAGVTAKQVDVLAQSLLRKAGIDDEAIKTAENMLLTFTEVRNEVGRGNDVFNRATKAVVDMSVALDQDLRSTAIQVGKALQDPITGLTALRRVGVSFTAAQREQITALVQSGQIMQAQKIILRELQTEFGGTAAKVNQASGGVGTLREEIKNLAGDYAQALRPEIRDLVDQTSKWVNHLEHDAGARKQFRDDVVGIGHAVRDTAHVVHELTDAVGGTKNALELLIGLKVASWATGLAGDLGKIIGAGGATAAAEGAGAAAGAAEGAAATTGGLAGAKLAAKGLFGWLSRLKNLGLIAIPITLAFAMQDKSNFLVGKGSSGFVDWFFGGDPFGRAVAGALGLHGSWNSTAPQSGKTVSPPGGTASQRLTGGGRGVQLPASIKATHQTAGLAGFPAVDIMASPGTPILAPEDGMITRISGHEPTEAPPLGAGGPWGLSIYFVGSETGNTYYMTHLMKVAGQGSYRKGAVIGLIGNYPGQTPDHVHFAVHQGKAAEAYVPSGLFRPGDFLTSTGAPAPRRRRNDQRSPNAVPLDLQEALAQAGVTPGSADDRSALRAIIAWIRHRLAQSGVPQTTRIDLLNQEGSFLDQLAGLAPKKPHGPTKASAAALVNIHHTLDEVTRLVDRAGLAKKLDPALAKINDELAKKFVTTATLAQIRNRLGDITKATNAEIRRAADAVKANRQKFADTWAQLASDALDAFDKETAEHVGPTRSLLNRLIAAHDKDQIDQAVADAKKALDDALAGTNVESDSDILSRVREMVGKAALANALDRAQSQILGVNPQEISSSGLISQLQQVLAPTNAVDKQAVADAQKAYDEALYQQKVYYLGLQADAEDSAYERARADLRAALVKQLDDWENYYINLGEKASKAAADFATVWASVLAQFPTIFGGTDTSGSSTYVTLPGGITVPGGVIGVGFGGAFGGGFAANASLFPAAAAGVAAGRAGAGSPTSSFAHVHLSLGDGLEQLVDAKIVQATPGISLRIGREANRRRRGGRL